MRIADDPLDAVHPRKLFRRALRIAAGYQYAGGRVFTANPADGGSGIVVCRRRYGTCVEDDDFGNVARFSQRQPARGQLRFERGAVGLGGPTSEILHKDARSGHVFILAEVAERASPVRLEPPATVERPAKACYSGTGSVPFHIFDSPARSILSPVSGFLAEAGFTHSLTPARNCTFGCSYCYVPTMRVRGGLQKNDWLHWGEFTTFKSNAAGLLARSLRSDQVIYCSPLTDPYQPAEASRQSMPGILDALIASPPRVLVIQTRGPLILRDVRLLCALRERTTLRVSFSVTTDRDEVRRIFEPHCAPIEERWRTIRTLHDFGIETSVTLAPILPCDPEALVGRAIDYSDGPVVADPFHVRSVKRSGATTRAAASAICQHYGWGKWLEPDFHRELLVRMSEQARSAGREFGYGPSGFALLARGQRSADTEPLRGPG
jgi:DNA repair photolyase